MGELKVLVTTNSIGGYGAAISTTVLSFRDEATAIKAAEIVNSQNPSSDRESISQSALLLFDISFDARESKKMKDVV